MIRSLGVAILYFSRSGKYGAYALAAALESRHKDLHALLIDLDRESCVVERLRELARKFRKLIVGVSFNSLKLDYVRHLASAIKTFIPNAILVAGGPHPSADPLGTLTKLGFDLAVVGEGEETMLELVEDMRNGGEGRVCGTAYIEGSSVVVKRRSRFVNLDEFPPTPTWRGIFGPIEIMRGCASCCRFCQVCYVFGRPRYRSKYAILSYARAMWSKGLRDLRFIAPNSFGWASNDGIKPNPSALLDLLESLRAEADRYGGRIFLGTFPSEVRPDSTDPEMVKELRGLVDNKRVIVGAQSGSDRMLKLMNRRHSAQDVIDAVDALIKAGFEVDVDIIFGLPGETHDDILETLKLCKALVDMGARIHAHTFMPLPGTPLDSAPPGSIPHWVKKEIAKLVGKGKAYGYWREQEVLARVLVSFRESKLFYTLHEQRKRIKTVIC
ncbi:MAG: TIGR04013 family B12-binding domain/radical SAM domain-containing protein [Crenarchaeota archaeon]|nr:TIGR04013 family B12-binding domain/radical SAM domain-containing protein [Thermoproteota archaeon]